jgi:hypothetical protein
MRRAQKLVCALSSFLGRKAYYYLFLSGLMSSRIFKNARDYIACAAYGMHEITERVYRALLYVCGIKQVLLKCDAADRGFQDQKTIRLWVAASAEVAFLECG